MAKLTNSDERKIDNIRIMMPLDLKSRYKEKCAALGVDMSEPVRGFVERFIAEKD